MHGISRLPRPPNELVAMVKTRCLAGASDSRLVAEATRRLRIQAMKSFKRPTKAHDAAACRGASAPVLWLEPRVSGPLDFDFELYRDVFFAGPSHELKNRISACRFDE